MNKISLSVLALFVLLSFASCGKKEDAKPKTPRQILTATIWKVEKTDFGITIANGLIPVPDSLNQNPLENIVGGTFEFKEDGKLVVTPPQAGQTPVNGTWELSADDKTLKMKGFFDNAGGGDLPLEPAQIEQLETYKVAQLTVSNLDLNNSVKFKFPIQGFPIPIDIEVKSALFLVPKK
jgi:hypothetical protein